MQTLINLLVVLMLLLAVFTQVFLMVDSRRRSKQWDERDRQFKEIYERWQKESGGK
jgi:hypothetical protein